ncbi:MAG: nucleoside hydrolase [Clostridiales Family XIII bacterium]|jgi:purine nucleosidase|nr:nucleoside hydrolase [Clostridiales Family XIII bacterium]
MNHSAGNGDRIVFDCDNTFGIPAQPFDDGLALLYLLGKRAPLAGITATYGNSGVDVTYENTRRMLRDIGRTEIPVLKGGASKDDRRSEAARFLVRQADACRGGLRILATGALTNLRAAYELDPGFFGKIKELVLMGGITEALFPDGRGPDELNFSCDPEASHCVLTNGKNISIATGNNCLPAYIRRDEHETRLTAANRPVGRYIREQTKSWLDAKAKIYGLDGFYAWDAVAAVYLLEKRFFADRAYPCAPAPSDLARGYIGHADGPPARTLNLPLLRDVGAFAGELYENLLCV